MNAMHLPRQLQRKRRLSHAPAAVQQMFTLRPEPPTHNGIPPGLGIHGAYKRAIYYFHIRSCPFAERSIAGKLETHMAAFYKEVPLHRISAQILRLYGVRKQIPAPPFSRDFLWQKDRTSQKARRAHRSKEYLRLRRSNNRGHLVTGVDLRQGLQLLEPDQIDYELCSRIHFERIMEAYRFKTEADKVGVGPPEQDALYRLSRSEIALRKIFISKRMQTLKQIRDDPQLLLLRRAPLPDATQDT